MRNTVIIIIILISSIQLPMNVLAQEQPQNELGAWYDVAVQYGFTDKLKYEGVYSHRLFNVVSDFQQLLWRTGLNYKLDDAHSLSAGFDLLIARSFTDDSFRSTEYRSWAHLYQTNKIGRLVWSNRFRVEQRYIETNNEFDFDNRFRIWTVLKYPLGRKKIESNTFYISAFNEVFVSVQENPFSQNWVFLGLGYKFSKAISGEVGYFNQYINQTGFDRIRFALGVNIPHATKKDIATPVNE